jgi:D-amino peptidase
MKVFLSADIEGVTGLTSVDETNADHQNFAAFAKQMTREVAAACEGALAAGADEILIKDAHWTARNIDATMLPRQARLIRGWSGHPLGMMDGLNESFAASLFIGFHSRAGSAGNPLAHTWSGTVIQELKVNDIPASEFRMGALTSNYLGVPTAFLSGDLDLCREVKDYCEGMETFATFTGRGLSTESVHPDTACEEIRARVEKVLKGDLSQLLRENPQEFTIQVEYKKPPEAYHRSFYPGVELKDERFITFTSSDWFEILRCFSFIL